MQRDVNQYANANDFILEEESEEQNQKEKLRLIRSIMDNFILTNPSDKWEDHFDMLYEKSIYQLKAYNHIYGKKNKK